MKLLNLLLAVGLAAFMFGCAPSDEAPAEGTPAPETETTMTDDSSTPAGESGDMEMAVFRDKDGDIVCPMMGAKISDPSKAVGHVDYEGVRYYLCCDACKSLEEDGAKAKQLAEEKFPDGKAL